VNEDLVVGRSQKASDIGRERGWWAGGGVPWGLGERLRGQGEHIQWCRGRGGGIHEDRQIINICKELRSTVGLDE
jgi:hypothetical protein